MILWGASAAIGMLQAWIYSEPATMFGHRSGGIALYAHEGWRKYTTLVGPLSAFGYWIGWSVVLSIFGKIIGDLATSQWWPNSGLSIAFAGNTLTLSSFIAIGCIIFVWVFNIFGLRLAVWFTYACAALLMVPMVLFIIVPYFTGHWHGSNVHAHFPGPWGGVKLAIVYMFILAWSTYGTEACATFAPEYKSIQDTHRALRSSAMFMLLVCLLLPLGLGGIHGVNAAVATGAEGQFYTSAMTTLVGHGAASFFTICIIASLLLSMTSSTADAGRALYGISRAGMTIKAFGVLSRFHVPARAMTLDLVVNIALVLFIKSNLAILYMSNIGYVLAHVFALSGFLLLRRDRPNWPRPIKVGSGVAADRGVPVRAQRPVPGGRRARAQAQRLRDLDRLRDRHRDPGRLAAAVHLPAGGRGQGGRAPARGRAPGARRGRDAGADRLSGPGHERLTCRCRRSSSATTTQRPPAARWSGRRRSPRRSARR